jgi:hypothetical protein
MGDHTEKFNKIMSFFQGTDKSFPGLDRFAHQLAKLNTTTDFNDYLTSLAKVYKTNPNKMYFLSLQYLPKTIEWLPSLTEVILFASFIAIIYILVEIFHNNYINNKVRSQSRCVKNKDENNVTVVDQYGNALYTVKYDNKNKTPAQINCEGSGTGKYQNTYNVKVYDYNTKQSTTQTQTCQQQPFTAFGGTSTTTSAPLFYSGNQNLVNFMVGGDTTYFST